MKNTIKSEITIEPYNGSYRCNKWSVLFNSMGYAFTEPTAYQALQAFFDLKQDNNKPYSDMFSSEELWLAREEALAIDAKNKAN